MEFCVCGLQVNVADGTHGSRIIRTSSSMQRTVHFGSYVRKNLFSVPLYEIGMIKYRDRYIRESRILPFLRILIFPSHALSWKSHVNGYAYSSAYLKDSIYDKETSDNVSKRNGETGRRNSSTRLESLLTSVKNGSHESITIRCVFIRFFAGYVGKYTEQKAPALASTRLFLPVVGWIGVSLRQRNSSQGHKTWESVADRRWYLENQRLWRRRGTSSIRNA